MTLGYQALLHDLGVDLPVRLWTDSSATMGICSRQGLGKLRHVDTRSLWVQQRVRDGALEIRKVRGEVNPADLFTKHLSSEDRVNELLKLFGCRYAEGRAKGAPLLRRDAGVSHMGILACDMVYETEGDTIEQDGRRYPATRMEGPQGDGDGGELVAEAYLHDVRCLPHCIQGDLGDLFPRAKACRELEEVQEPVDDMEEYGRRIGQSART